MRTLDGKVVLLTGGSRGLGVGGMLLEWGRKPPAMAGSVSTKQVADAVVKAILRNRAEIVVIKGAGKIADWVQAAAPETNARIFRWIGVTSFMREQARINAERAARDAWALTGGGGRRRPGRARAPRRRRSARTPGLRARASPRSPGDGAA